jgi:hypothetical protein
MHTDYYMLDFKKDSIASNLLICLKQQSDIELKELDHNSMINSKIMKSYCYDNLKQIIKAKDCKFLNK